MSPLGKLGNWITAVVALLVVFFALVFGLAGIGLTGMAPIFGEVGERTAAVAVRDSLPAVRAIVEPAGRVLWTEGGRAVKGLLPEGAVSLGPLTINPIWKNDGDIVTSNIGSLETGGSSVPGGDSPVPTAVPPCITNTSESLAALEAWKIGQWETAVANINLTRTDDCLAKGLYANYMQPFEIALGVLQNADGEAQIRASAETTKRLNPAYAGSYSAIRFVDANRWLTSKPLDVTQRHLLAGATIRVAAADMSWWCAQHTALCERKDDQFDVSVDFERGWVATYLFSRVELQQLETALGLTAGAITTVGNSVKIPGSVMPDQIPVVPAPNSDQYATPTLAPISPTAEVLCQVGMVIQATWPRWEMIDGFPTETSIFPTGLTLTGEQLGDGEKTICKASDGSWAWPGSWLGWMR